MSNPINDGGAAFPSQSHDRTGAPDQDHQYGMTLRDYFAANAAAEQFKFAVGAAELIQQAARCYAIADAMIAARKEKP